MKSIKPGRGPSLQGGVGYVFGAVFCILWTVGAASIGAPTFFVLFGVIGVILFLINAFFQFHNATSKNRHSVIDIVDAHEEPDPLNIYFGKGGDGHVPDDEISAGSKPAGFCPYCGAKAQRDYAFCAQCGKELPR